MRAAEGRLVMDVGEWLSQRYGDEMLCVAWQEFMLGEDEDESITEHAEFAGLFVPWALFCWRPALDDEDPPDWPRTPLGLAYLEARGQRLDALERRFLEAVCARPFSFHQVLAVEPGRSLRLRDLLTGEECEVAERSASASVTKGTILFGRTVAIDDLAILCGVGLYEIPPSEGPRLLDLRDELAREGATTAADLAGFEGDVRAVYLDISEQLQHPMPPQLENTDGDPLEPTTLRFSLTCPPEQAFDALRDLAVGARREDLLADAVLDARGALRAVSLPWLKRGNRMHRSWDNTVLGELAIEGQALTVEVNSSRRAGRARRLVERRLGSDVVFECQETRTLDDLAEAARARGTDERKTRREEQALQEEPEVRALTERMRREHWQAWLDDPLPALGGSTPREAARGARGRERLEALLLHFEWGSERVPNPLAPDVPALRHALGLEDGGLTDRAR